MAINATSSLTDLAERTVSVTDAVGATTTTVYDIAHDQPAVVTDAAGNTSCYKYDHRGRKIAEWGTAIQPACFGYDDMDNMTTLRTFRAGTEVITSDPTERTDGDVTTWAFNAVTGLEISKTYADNTTVVKTYDAYNRLATETDARGNVKTRSYEHARGLHLGTSYSDNSITRSFTYNHLGLMTQLVDDAGIRTYGYNTYGERESDSLVVDGDTHLIAEQRDSFGRSTGFAYSKNGTVQHTVTTGYGTDGRISNAGFTHGGAVKQFGYEYLNGTNLLHKLTKPNNMTLTQTYEATRDLLTGMAYHRGSTLVAQREYTYDILGRPTARNTARQGKVVNDTFTHNTRSELAAATVNGADYAYLYDNIGNQTTAVEGDDSTVYTANALNQYTSIQENAQEAFSPQFDTDGNQTLIKTSTGIWSAVYNAENRPITFTNSENNTVVECAYDSMGRRAYKKVTTNGTVTLHQRYIYRGYLQIACIDLTRSHHPALWLITWDPTQPVATRPLAIQINGTWLSYGWDLTKNICELYGTTGYISTAYTYTPFGKVTASGSVTQPIQWSSEFNDRELDIVYYNYRYFLPQGGRWLNRDRISDINENNLYRLKNPIAYIDRLGLKVKALFIGEDEQDRSYLDVEGDINYLSMRIYEVTKDNKEIYYKDIIDKIRGIPEIKFNRMVRLGNLKQMKYEHIKTNERNGRNIVEDKTLSDNKSEFIKRLERELESSSVAKKITVPSPEDALNSILNYSQNHFMQFSDLREYDFNLLIMHGWKNGKIYYQNDMIAEISTIKSKFEERKYNSAMNYFFSCYMEGYSILAGVRKPLLQISKDCEIIKFTPSAPFYSNRLI